MSAVLVTPGARRTARSARPALTLAGVLLVLLVLTALVPRLTRDDTPLSIGNAGDTGARALAQVLGDHGVDVRGADGAGDAVRRAGAPDTTLVVVFPGVMDANVSRAVEALPDVVYIGTEQVYGRFLDGLRPRATTAIPPGTPVGASGCEGPGAAAGSVTRGGYGLEVTGGWRRCFDLGDGMWAFADRETPGGHRAVIADSRLVRNVTVAEFGNAALAVNAIGRTDHVVWYVAQLGDTLSDPVDPAPAWLVPGVLLLCAAGLTLALARGRRLGRLVPEDLATPVPAIESVVGRGRLLRSSRQYAHAARALRAATARRLAARLAVAPSSDPDPLHAALVRAGIPADRALEVLWGPDPTTEGELVALADSLSRLEEDIHHD